MGAPLSTIEPEVRSRSPARQLSAVVFPHPLGPRRVTKVPPAISRVKSCKAVVAPKRRVTPRMTSDSTRLMRASLVSSQEQEAHPLSERSRSIRRVSSVWLPALPVDAQMGACASTGRRDLRGGYDPPMLLFHILNAVTRFAGVSGFTTGV